MQFIFTITSETLIIQFGVMDDWRLVSIPWSVWSFGTCTKNLHKVLFKVRGKTGKLYKQQWARSIIQIKSYKDRVEISYLSIAWQWSKGERKGTYARQDRLQRIREVGKKVYWINWKFIREWYDEAILYHWMLKCITGTITSTVTIQFSPIWGA